MAKYRDALPQLSGDLFIADGGIETTLIYLEEIELPYFAAFDLLKNRSGQRTLNNYYEKYVQIACEHQTGFILESPTWRASLDWAKLLGYGRDALMDLNREAIWQLEEIRKKYENPQTPIVISGCVGPRGDGYDVRKRMTRDDARSYHALQIDTFSESNADMVTAVTMNYVEEAIGVVEAAKLVDMPIVISFTVETDGCLPTCEPIKAAIERVDHETDGGPIYYMINCAHPTHFDSSLVGDGDWLQRIRGIRVNASTKSHAELDKSEQLDDGDPEDLAERCGEMRGRLPNLNVIGGCCGTDHRHIEAMCRACNF